MSQQLWQQLRQFTRARIGLGRSGDALPTAPLLDFQQAHGSARDAVHTPLDTAALLQNLHPHTAIVVASAVADRREYLQRPDYGRQLADSSRSQLHAGDYDLALVLADGLSARAVQAHAAATAHAIMQRLSDWRIAPLVIATQSRVALGDEIGQRLGARLVAMLIGERPGLSAADSLGIYLTFAPRPGRLDSERNCISNIHPPDGLTYPQAADKLAWLARAARRLQLTGVQLKDTQDTVLESQRPHKILT